MRRTGSRLLASRAALGLLVVLAASCTSQPVLLPSRDFNRPTDITFVCMGAFPASGETADAGASDAEAPDASVPAGPTIVSGRPMRECHPRGFDDVPDTIHHTFAFLPNSESGELSVIDADKWNFVNLDPANPGFNRLPIGRLPTQIAASDDGCRLVTANHGSCDLSFVDPAALMTPTIALETPSTQKIPTPTGSPIVTNVVPVTKSRRPLQVLAGEVAFLPMVTAGAGLCSTDPGHQWQALATFPSCDLVALIDLPSGVIQRAAYATKTASGDVQLTPIPDGVDPVCHPDCTYPPVPDASPEASTDGADGAEAAMPGDDAATAEAGGSDAGAPDADVSDGSAPEAGARDAGPAVQPAPPGEPGDVPYVGPGALRPGPIAIIPESGRAFVGLGNAAFVLAFNVGPNLLDLSTAGAIRLNEGALGVDRIRLSIDPYKDKTAGALTPPGSFIGDDPALDNTSTDSKENAEQQQFAPDRQYLYVVARDGSLRIVQVAHQLEWECETNLDFTTPAGSQLARNVACPQVVGPSVRRPGTIGPGIRLPAPPVDVAAVDVRPDPPDMSETSVSGAHAYVLTASGAVYLVNIDPVPRHIFFVEDNGHVQMCETPASADCKNEPAPTPNTLRNKSFLGYSVQLDTATGPPRLDVPPSQPSIGPRVEAIWTQGSAANATALTGDFIRTSVFFPDPTNVSPQSWAVTWEGNLLANPRLTGQITGTDPITHASTLDDLGMDFCRIGVQDRDLVTLVGCTNTNQCGIGEVCAFGSNGAEGEGGFPITGLCVKPTVPSTDCDDLLSTIKRYEITSAQKSELEIVPHRDELVRPALSPCTPSGSGGPAGDGGAGTDAATDASRAQDARDANASSPADAGDGGAPMKDDCFDPQDPSTMLFRCDPTERRCLSPCTVEGSTMGCRTGRVCVLFGSRPTDSTMNACDGGRCFCADAPPLDGEHAKVAECLGELFAYQVGAGRSFVVSGSTAGIPATGVADATGACVPIPNLDPRLRARISMDAPACAPPVVDNNNDSRCNPNLPDPGCPSADANSDPAARKTAATTTANQLQALLRTPNDPNPCLFNGGPNETDLPNTAPSHVHAMFRNREIQFMLTNLEQPPSGVFQIRFDVHGGFQPQQVIIPPSTVEVTMPARIVLGPFDQNNPAQPVMNHVNAEVPYLFVVDQRRLGRTQGGGPTRGQLLRINPRGAAITIPVTGSQPWYEDLTHSANLFPMQ
jgi:hypothetical protein